MEYEDIKHVPQTLGITKQNTTLSASILHLFRKSLQSSPILVTCIAFVKANFQNESVFTNDGAQLILCKNS